MLSSSFLRTLNCKHHHTLGNSHSKRFARSSSAKPPDMSIVRASWAAGSIGHLCRRGGDAFRLVDRPLEVADTLAQRAAHVTELARPENDQDDQQQND